MNLLIYPGIHSSALTEAFHRQLLNALPISLQNCWVMPAGYGVLCGLSGLTTVLASLADRSAITPYTAINRSLTRISAVSPLSVIAFSGGVVGASQLINVWQRLGGKVACFIAIDGWGVPLQGPFPTVRLSHDWFTCWSSVYLSEPHTQHFYAEPAVEHLHLWQQAGTVTGWSLSQTDFNALTPFLARQPHTPKTDPKRFHQPTALELICRTLLETNGKGINQTYKVKA